MHNISLKAKGFVIKNYGGTSTILFLNELNECDYAFVEIFNGNLKLTKEQTTEQ